MACWIWRSTSLGEVVDILDADAAGVDELEVAVAEPDRAVTSAIARDAGVGSTMAMRRPASQLNSDDLPTLGRPTMAT